MKYCSLGYFFVSYNQCQFYTALYCTICQNLLQIPYTIPCTIELTLRSPNNKQRHVLLSLTDKHFHRSSDIARPSSAEDEHAIFGVLRLCILTHYSKKSCAIFVCVRKIGSKTMEHKQGFTVCAS